MDGKVNEAQSSKAGTYILGQGPINNYPHWLNADKNQALWFDKIISNWKFGSIDGLGQNVNGIASLRGRDSYPNKIKDWYYYDGNSWPKADSSEITIKAIGKHD